MYRHILSAFRDTRMRSMSVVWLVAMTGCPLSTSGCDTPSKPTIKSFDLGGVPVEVTLPHDFELDAESDPSLGIVTFSRRQRRSFMGCQKQILHGDLYFQAQAPRTLSDAVTLVRGDYCGTSPRCDLVSSEEMAYGGYLITLRMAWQLTTVMMKPVPGRPELLRCSASATDGCMDGWLDDAQELQRFRSVIESICRSARAPFTATMTNGSSPQLP
jgi:hypothetical protein